MTVLSERACRIYSTLLEKYGAQKCYLDHMNPLQLLVATILSAQCTDKRVNIVTVPLFKKYKTASDFASADTAELESMIHSCGYYHAKAAAITGSCRAITERFGGEVPSSMEDLVTLPGVGRKTANVVLSDSFNIPGFPVDTHVKRISGLMGLAKSDDPVKIERELCRLIEPEKWGQFSHLLIIHGRMCCRANHPACETCPVERLCPRKGLKCRKTKKSH